MRSPANRLVAAPLALPGFSPVRRVAALMLCLVLAGPARPAAPLPVELTVEELLYGETVVTDLRLRWKGETLEFGAGRVSPNRDSGTAVRDFRASCEQRLTQPETFCAGGEWSLLVQIGDEEMPLRGSQASLRQEATAWLLQTGLDFGAFHARVEGKLDGETARARADFSDQGLASLGTLPLAPDAQSWLTGGSVSGTVSFLAPADAPPSLDYELRLAQLAFDSPDGRFAAMGLDATVGGKFRPSARRSRGSISIRLAQGELLLDDFYTSFTPHGLELSAGIVYEGTRLSLDPIRAADGGGLLLAARASLDTDDPVGSFEYGLDRLELNFPAAYQRYLEPLASASTLNGLVTSGRLSWQGAISEGKQQPALLEIEDLSVVDTLRGRFALTGLEAAIRPDEQGIDSRLAWRGMLFQRINLGSGEAMLSAREGRIGLAHPLVLDVLGGKLELARLEVNLPRADAEAGAEPDILLQARLQKLQMAQLAEALGWPAFGGEISGNIPAARFDEGVIWFDGGIDFNVFDGRVALSELRVERPFGVLPSLSTDIAVQGLDLEQLTSTFSFGRISGRLDGAVQDLRLLDWQPVAFDAWLGTPQQQAGSQRISRQAVSALTSIGGGRAAAALAGPVLKMFSNFSYRRLGFGCRLSNNVCAVRGLEDSEHSVLIMEGSGVPKVMIRAYNRNMDWPQLVANLTAATAGEDIRIGDKP